MGQPGTPRQIRLGGNAVPTGSHDTREHFDSFLGFDGQKVVGVETKFTVKAVSKGNQAIKDLVLNHYRPDGATISELPISHLLRSSREARNRRARRSPSTRKLWVIASASSGVGSDTARLLHIHDREERVAQAAQADGAVLLAGGFELEWFRREPAMWAVVAAKGGEKTKLEWVVDSDYRFFPTVRDETFGYMLHPVDLATNKLMAAAARREPRDVVDLLTIHDRVLPLGAVAWAAVDKSPGFTPEGLINEVRRVGRYTAADFRRVASDPPIDPAATMTRLREILEEAEAFVARMPNGEGGLAFPASRPGGAARPGPDGELPNPCRTTAGALAEQPGNQRRHAGTLRQSEVLTASNVREAGSSGAAAMIIIPERPAFLVPPLSGVRENRAEAPCASESCA